MVRVRAFHIAQRRRVANTTGVRTNAAVKSATRTTPVQHRERLILFI